jgi:predicted nucleic acid-binding protein
VILADTSVWVDHFRRGNPGLQKLLLAGEILTHPFVVGEIACGNLHKRTEVLVFLHALPAANAATDEEVLWLIEQKRWHGKGIGWVDAHLLASALLTGCPLWTLDRCLRATAIQAGVGH